MRIGFKYVYAKPRMYDLEPAVESNHIVVSLLVIQCG